jgi:hypothetical protein
MVATIDPTIFVNKADFLSLNPRDCNFRDLHDAIKEEAANASEIVALGGWCKPRFILDLCRQAKKSRRHNIRIRIGVGRDLARPMLEQWRELHDLRSDLVKSGFTDLEIRLISKGSVHFHTKLFGFLRKTHWSWYVGSTNPTESRLHEMMVRVGSKHEALKVYVDRAIKAGLDVARGKPATEQSVRSINEFFLRGQIAYKPTPSSLFAFDAMQLKSAERAVLDKKSAGDLKIRHAKIETSGYSFLLLEAMGVGALNKALSLTGGDSETKRLPFKQSSIETPYGWWVPPTYADQILIKIKTREAALEESLRNFLKNLRQDRKTATKFFSEYVLDMRQKFQDAGLAARSEDILRDRFEKFLDRRLDLLDDEEGRRRLCRVVEMNPMPNFLQDERAYGIFSEAFFEYVAFRKSQRVRGKGAGSIIDRLEQEEGTKLDWENPISLMEAFDLSIQRRPWNDSEWRGGRERRQG